VSFTPYKHQTRLLGILRNEPRFGIWADMGLGKTATMLQHCKNQPMKTLVVCPINIIESAWIDDNEKFGFGHHIVSLWAKSKRRKIQVIEESWDIGCVNYETFMRYYKEYAAAGVERVIFDESSKIKSYESKVTKNALKFVWMTGIKQCYLLSGTPAPNGEIEYFPQIRCISQNTFPDSFWVFRATYFYPTGYEGHVWKMKKDMMPCFMRRMKKVSITIKKEDCIDLPAAYSL